MSKEFKITAYNKQTTVYTLESASSGGTSSGSVASVSSPMGGVQRRKPGQNLIAQEANKETVPTTTPRNFVAKNAKMGGAGAHRDKKKEQKQGVEKHKKPYTEDHSDAANRGWGAGSYDTYAGGRHGRGVAENPEWYNDEANSMSTSQLKSLVKHAAKLRQAVKAMQAQGDTLEPWQQSKVTKAADYLDAVFNAVDDEHDMGEEQGGPVSEISNSLNRAAHMKRHDNALAANMDMHNSRAGIAAIPYDKAVEKHDIEKAKYKKNIELNKIRNANQNAARRDADHERIATGTNEGVAEGSGDDFYAMALQKYPQLKQVDREIVINALNNAYKDYLMHYGYEGIGPDEESSMIDHAVKGLKQGVAEAKGKLTYTPEPTEYGVFPDSKNEFVKTFLSLDLALAHIKKFGGKLIVLDQHGRRMKEGVAEGYDEWAAGIDKRKASMDAQYGEHTPPSKTLSKLMRIPGFNKVSPAEQQRVAKAVDGYLARDMSFDQALVLAQKQGVAEGSEYKSRHAHKQEQDKAYADYRTKHNTSRMALMTRAEFAKDQRERAAKKKQGVAEEWSQKYKSSINCSHPKGFSQKAHCAGKKKHTESMMTMEAVCPDCGMCQTHGDNMMEVQQRLDAKCWSGKHKEGTKIKGGIRVNNCVPNESVEEDPYFTMLERSVSQAQHNLMVGVAHNPQFAQQVKVKQKVGQEFAQADVGHDISKLPIRVPKKK